MRVVLCPEHWLILCWFLPLLPVVVREGACLWGRVFPSDSLLGTVNLQQSSRIGSCGQKLSYWTRISLNHFLSLLYPHFSYFYLKLASSGTATHVANRAKPASGLTQFLQQVVFCPGLCWLPQW